MSPNNIPPALPPSTTSSSTTPVATVVALNGNQQPTLLQQQQLQPQQMLQLPVMQNMQQVPIQRLPVQYVQVPNCQPTVMQVPSSSQDQPLIVINNRQPQQVFSRVAQQPAVQQLMPVAAGNGISMQPYLPTYLNNNNLINNLVNAGVPVMQTPMMAVGGSNILQQVQQVDVRGPITASIMNIPTINTEKSASIAPDVSNANSQPCFCASQPNIDNTELGFFTTVSEVKDFLSKQTGATLSAISTKIIEKETVASLPSDPCVAASASAGASVIHRGSEDVVALVQRHRDHAIGCRRSYSLSGLIIWDAISTKVVQDARQHLQAAFNDNAAHFTEALQLCQCARGVDFQSFAFGCTLNAEDGAVGGSNNGFCVFKDNPAVEKVPSSFGGSAVAKSIVDSIDCVADQLSALATTTLPKAALKRHAQLRESALECSWGTTSKACGRLFSSAIGEWKGSVHRRRIKRPIKGSAAAIVNLSKGTSMQFLPKFVLVGDVDAASSEEGGGGKLGGMVGVAMEARSVFITRADFWRSSNNNPTSLMLAFYVENGLDKRNHGSSSSNNRIGALKVAKGEKRKKETKDRSGKSKLALNMPQNQEPDPGSQTVELERTDGAVRTSGSNILEQCMDAIFGEVPLTIDEQDERKAAQVEENADNVHGDDDDDDSSIPTDDSSEDVDSSDSEDDMVDVETSEVDEGASATAASIVSQQNLANSHVQPQALQLASQHIQLLQQQYSQPPQPMQQQGFVNSFGKPVLAVSALQHDNSIAQGHIATPLTGLPGAAILQQSSSVSAGPNAVASTSTLLGCAANAPSTSLPVPQDEFIQPTFENISPADNDNSAVANADTSSLDGDDSLEDDDNDGVQALVSQENASTATTAAKQRKTKSHFCPICGKGYSGPYNMRRHFASKHPNSEIPALPKNRQNEEAIQRVTPPKKQKTEENKELGKFERPPLRRSKRR